MRYIILLTICLFSVVANGQGGKIVLHPFQDEGCPLRYRIPNPIYIQKFEQNNDSLILKCKIGKITRLNKLHAIYYNDSGYAKSSETFYLYKNIGDSLLLLDSLNACISRIDNVKVNLFGITSNKIQAFDTLGKLPLPILKLSVTCFTVTSYRIIHYRGDSIVGNYEFKKFKVDQLDSAYNTIVSSMKSGDRLLYYDIRIEVTSHGLPFEVTIYRKED